MDLFELSAARTNLIATQMSNQEHQQLKLLNMLPIGSALITPSGQLKHRHIQFIIHAASGSMTKSGSGFDPTLKSIADSLENSIRLAMQNNIKTIAVPFIGGGIFAQRIGTTNQRIAAVLLDTAKKYSSQLQINFVIFGMPDFSLFSSLKATMQADQISVLEGSITDFNLHGSAAIVNAANTEVIFGGGLSGIIGRETGETQQINQEVQNLIRQFYLN